MILQDIANWVCVDYLNRSDLLPVANNAVIEVYRTVCAKIPFDQLMVTSSELPMVSGTDTYDLVAAGPTQLIPTLRAIASIRVTFSSTNRRRPRRSHVRVYDSLSFTTPGFIATYARFGNAIIFNPPPNDSSYTFRIRYWSRPTLGVSTAIGNTYTWSGGVATATASGFTGNFIGVNVGDQITVAGLTGGSAGYNVTQASVLSASTLVITYPVPVNPGGSGSGGIIYDNSLTPIIIPDEWSDLLKYETLYRVYHYLDQQDKAGMLMQPPAAYRQATPKKTQIFETGIIPRLWNDLLTTVSQQENTDEDFSINPVIRAYSVRR